MTNIFLILMITLSITFTFLNHPLSFGLILLIQTILTSLVSGKLSMNYWFSYILFLIMIGGMLILFIYMTSIASNEKFKFSFKILLFSLTMTFFSIIMSLIDPLFSSMKYMNADLISQIENTNNFLSMNKYMNYPSNIILSLIILYLLLTLIAVVKITDSQYGPLRQKF